MVKYTILNLCASYRFRSTEQNLTKLEGEIHKSTISVGEFNNISLVISNLLLMIRLLRRK